MLSASAARAISPIHVCSRRRGLLGKQKADDLMQRKFDVILVLLEFFFFFFFHADEYTAAHSTCATLPEPNSLSPLPFPVVSQFTKKQKNKKKTKQIAPKRKTGVSSRRHSSQTPPSLPFLSPLPVPQELGKQTRRPAPVPSIIH